MAAEIAKADNRRTVKYEDVAQVVARDERVTFLNGKKFTLLSMF